MYFSLTYKRKFNTKHIYHYTCVNLSHPSHIWYMMIYAKYFKIIDLNIHIKFYWCPSKAFSWNSWMINDIYQRVIFDITRVKTKHREYILANKWSVNKYFKLPLTNSPTTVHNELTCRKSRHLKDWLTVDDQALHL